MSRRIIATSSALAALFSIVLHVALNSPISPLPLDLPASSLKLHPNNLLKNVEKVGEGSVILPEDTCVGRDGKLYTATRDGWIKRRKSNGSWENWKMIGGSALLGIAPASDGDIIVCDADQGLIKVGEKGITILATEADGSKIIFADDAIEGSDGSIYFSDASSRFGFHEFLMDLLEARTNGRLLKYDPSKKTASNLLSNLSFPNGVALSPDEDYLLISETWKFRVIKYWLKGKEKGKREIFIDNLPGGPDNINLAPDGSFWIAIIQIRSWWLDVIHKSPMAKMVIATIPRLDVMMNSIKKSSIVINVDSEGQIKRILDDSDGTVMSFVTSALEHQGHLYMGSLHNNFIGKFNLNG